MHESRMACSQPGFPLIAMREYLANESFRLHAYREVLFPRIIRHIPHFVLRTMDHVSSLIHSDIVARQDTFLLHCIGISRVFNLVRDLRLECRRSFDYL